MNNEQIQQIALANGFKLKEQPDGTMALNPYVFEFAKALLAAAPTPPEREDEPDAWRFLDTKWGEYSYDETPNPHRQCEPLYTRPQSDELRKAADEACVAIEAQEGPIRGDLFTAWKSLRGVLDKAK